MSEQNTGSAELEPQEPTQSVGTILKQAREKMGLSLDELSEQIKVPVNVLEAIEIDKVPKNLPETFIRGYIRSYARKVEIDETVVLPEVETVAAINKTTSQSESGMQSFSRRTRRKASEKRLVYFTWLMIIAVVIAVVIWWLQDSEKSGYAPVVETQPTTITEVVSAQPNESSIDEGDAINAEPVSTAPIEQPPLATEPQQQTEPSEQLTIEKDEPVELTAEQKAIVADDGKPDEGGFLKVEMKFDTECWVEVYDVAGERIAVGNKPAGYLMTLNAQGPLNVLLGNPVGVSVWVNGKVFDMSEHPKNRVARFELEAM